jgi:hypothetical protein
VDGGPRHGLDGATQASIVFARVAGLGMLRLVVVNGSERPLVVAQTDPFAVPASGPVPADSGAQAAHRAAVVWLTDNGWRPAEGDPTGSCFVPGA